MPKPRKMLKSFKSYLDRINSLDYSELRDCINSDIVWDNGTLRRNSAAYELFATHEHLDFAKEDIFKFSGIVLDQEAFESAAEKVAEIWRKRLPELFPDYRFVIYKDPDHRQIAFCRQRTGITEDPDEIISCLNHENPHIRWNALFSATIFPNPKLVPHLIRRLDDDDIYNRLKAIVSLGANPDPRVIPELLERFFKLEKNPAGKYYIDDFFSYDLLKTLISLGEEGYQRVFALFRDYKSLDMHTLEHLCELLGCTGRPEVLEILLEIYYNEPDMSEHALTGLLKMEKQALPRIIAGLESPDFNIRKKSMWFLANCYDRSVRPYLVEGLKDRKKEVREAAVHGIGRFYHRSRTSLLLKALNDRATVVRVKALEALGSLFRPSLLPLFQELCFDKNPHVRHEAMRAIAALDSKAGIRFLNELYDKSDGRDRIKIIHSLYAYTGDPSNLKPIIAKALASRKKQLVQEAMDLLEIIEQ